jgi:MFS family permease
VLPLYVEQAGMPHGRVAFLSGVLFSIMACAGALGHHFCGRLMRRYQTRTVIAGGTSAAAIGAGLIAASGNIAALCIASAVFGVGIGAAMTASYSAAGSVIPSGAHGTGFGVLTSASLIGMATSPFVAGLLGGASIRVVFLLDVVMMGGCALLVGRSMKEAR